MKSWALQEAVYARLNHSSVTGLLSTAYGDLAAVFSDVPQVSDSEDTSYFPYVTLGADAVSAWDTKDNTGGEALVLIDVWTRETTFETAKTIADAIDARMRRQALSITGATHVETELSESQNIRDPDGKTKHIAIRYRVLYLSN